MADIIQLRRDTAANWVTANPVLHDGEIGIETDTRKRKCGNGTTAWNSLPYMYSDDLDSEPTANSHKPVESGGTKAAIDIASEIGLAALDAIGDADNVPTEESTELVRSGGVWEAIRNNGKGAFDISAYKAVGGVLAKYDDLAQALGTNGANVPAAARKPGMSVCFVLNSDNMYVQYRLMADTFVTNPVYWQGVDDGPTAGSDNFVKSSGVHKAINGINEVLSYTTDSLLEVEENGKVIGRNYDESSDTGYSGIVSVEGGGEYLVSTYKYSSDYYPLVLYKKNGAYISYDRSIHPSGLNVNILISVPEDADQMVINANESSNIRIQKVLKDNQVCKKLYDDNNQELLQAGVFKYEPKEFVVSENLINRENLPNSAGVHTSIEVYEGQKLLISGYKFGGEWPIYIFRKNGLIVAYETTIPNGINKNINITVPKDVDEVIVNSNYGNNIEVSIVSANTKLLASNYELLQINGVDNVLDRWNTTSTAEGKRYSVPVKEGDEFIINSFKYGSDGFPAYLLRKSGSIVSYFNGVPFGMPFGGLHVTIPSGVDEIVVNATKFFCEIWKRQDINPTRRSNWVGKKILWIGTSIPEKSNYTPNGNYPEQVAKALGAEVINVALGSSMARKGYLSRVSSEDSMGVTGVGFVAASRAMGMTIAEKQDLIENWNTKWDNIISDGTPHGALTDAEKTLMLSASYENKLVAHLDEVDLVVFDHGRNDYSGNTQDNQMDENNPFDMRTFQGAMNTYIKMIFENDLHKKVVMISHYESQQFPGLIAMQEEVAKYWGIPIFRLCDKLGWAYDRKINLHGHWISYGSGGYYWEETENSYEYRLTQAHIPDGTHPNTDLSGVASRDIAQKIIPFINDLGMTDY